MKYLSIFLIGLFCFVGGEIKAQEKVEGITLTGIVLKMDSIVPLPFTNIFLKATHMGVHSNEHGLFSIKVSRNDTIVFTAVGYQTTYYIVPDTLSVNHYSIIQHMPLNNIKLKTIEITSWPSLDQFNHAFTKEHGFDEELPNARINSNPMLNVKGPYEDNSFRYQNKYSFVYQNAHIPVRNLLNPKRWDKLVEGIKTGTY